MTLLTLALSESTDLATLTAIEQAARDRADAVELRIDYLNPNDQNRLPDFIQLARQHQLKTIVTLRHISEGGHFNGPSDRRNELLVMADLAGADFIDLEWASYQQSPFTPRNARLILSAHDFKTLPHSFKDLPGQMQSIPNAIPKVAFMPQTINDSFTALDIMHNYPGSIAIAMGEAGLQTRLITPKLNGFLSFFAPNASAGTAPGQITIQQSQDIYHWEAINSETQLFGVCGFPVAHSMSPAIHNAAFKAIDFNGLYLPLLIHPDHETFNQFLENILQRPWLNFRGLSVTVPHKENALKAIKARQGKIDPLAEKIGAINTIIFNSDSTLSGYNTDYTGAMNGIYQTLNIKKSDLTNMPTAVIGAGGAARAIVAGLTDARARVTVFNRTVKKAENLAQLFNCDYDSVNNLKNFKARLIVNCTTLGMHPNMDTCPVPENYLTKDMIVFDTVYNPLRTRLLKMADTAGAMTVDGLSMFINQAAEQFKLFTQKEPPLKIMGEKVKKILLEKQS